MSEPQVRLAAPNEVEAALRLLLGNDLHLADVSLVRQFIADAAERELRLDRLRIAVERSRILWAVLPLASAGKTGILVEPNRTLPRTNHEAITTLLRQSCDDLTADDVSIIQVLLDPDDAVSAALHARCGFEDLATLEYLRIPSARGSINLPTGFVLRPAPPDEDLAVALQRSYIDTLDCPRLNGLRSLPDIIAGYRNAHPYDPQLWHVLYESGSPVGVLILSAPGPHDPLELSYLGLAPTIRGQGLGKGLVHHARQIALARGSDELAVSVDAQNLPAKHLYFRAGARLVLTRRVIIRLPHSAPAPKRV